MKLINYLNYLQMCLSRRSGPGKMYIRGKSCHKSQTTAVAAAAVDCFHMVMSFRFSGQLSRLSTCRTLLHFIKVFVVFFCLGIFATNGVKVRAIEAELQRFPPPPPPTILFLSQPDQFKVVAAATFTLMQLHVAASVFFTHSAFGH